MHMEPTGKVALDEIKATIERQLQECIACLYQMQHGEGVLHSTMMTVNGIGKIDVYHYIYFLAQHAKRHLVQIEK